MIDSFLNLPLWPLLKQCCALFVFLVLVLFGVETILNAVMQLWRKCVAAAARRIQDKTKPQDQP